MIEQILPDVYRIKVPLPNSPLKDLNSYVIKSGGQSLVIDTGFNRTACYDAMLAGLGELGLDPSKTDFMLTHMHADHTGLISKLATPASKVYFGRIDARIYDRSINWQPMMAYALSNGFQAEDIQKAMDAHPGIKYLPETVPEFTLLDDGDVITVGDFQLQCILTPGHTKGHICLFDSVHRMLISGDHILYDITPHIESWSYETNSLKHYLDSLDRVRDLPVDIVLPGHRNTFTDLKGRVDALKEHHRQRALEVIEVIGDNSMTAYQIAAGMTWDIRCENFEQVPAAQKWFAVGEAIAHLRWLEGEGRIQRNVGEELVTFSAIPG
jgi:glyoxylase-like metal-dependent hydrolase (beta-lactamase superfamily II)